MVSNEPHFYVFPSCMHVDDTHLCVQVIDANVVSNVGTYSSKFKPRHHFSMMTQYVATDSDNIDSTHKISF